MRLQGRGKQVHQHTGNLDYRKIVKARCCEYRDRPEHRNEIAREIIQSIESLGGRFIRSLANQDGQEVWVRCEPSVVRTKVKQALRDMAKQEGTGSEASGSRNSGDQLQTARKDTSHREAAPKPAQTKEQHGTQPLASDSRASAVMDSIEMHMRARAMTRFPGSSLLDSNTGITKWEHSIYGSNQLTSNGFNYGNIPHLGQSAGSGLAETTPTFQLLAQHYQTAPIASNTIYPFVPTPLALDPVATSTQELMKRYMDQERNPFPGIPTGLTSTEIAELVSELHRQQH